jgi:hypothetical protein
VYVVKEKVTKLTTYRVVNFGQSDKKAALFFILSQSQSSRLKVPPALIP